MKEKIKSIIVLIVINLLTSLICKLVYDSLLLDTFKITLGYSQWIAIVIISNILFKPNPQPIKNDNEREKVSRNIFKNGF